jgi:exosortase C (VPDSG-CTERM-specific)
LTTPPLSPQAQTPASFQPLSAAPFNAPRRVAHFAVFLTALLVCFLKPLLGLFHLSLNNELYSHVLLVPAISLYLVWFDKKKLPSVFEPAPLLAASLLGPGLILFGMGWIGVLNGWNFHQTDFLSLMTLAFVLCVCGGFAVIFGKRITRSIGFPLAFLIFMVPMPVVLENAVVSFLQHASAETSYLMLKLSGMPVFRDGTRFAMPGVSIEVAPSCSGIRSSLVLFMSGLLAAHFFLRKPWAKITLATAVIALGIFRNSLRIFTLSQFAVRVDPTILNSGLHHQGGPLFFAISLVPFFILIWLLRKYELPRKTESPVERAL